MHNLELIHTYSRSQAIADGVLFSVPEDIAREAGFRVPVALTEAVYRDCVEWTLEDTERRQVAQDQEGRLWDVMAMARFAALSSPERSRVEFELLRVSKDGRGIAPKRVALVLMIHGGDDGEPIITIMFPHED